MSKHSQARKRLARAASRDPSGDRDRPRAAAGSGSAAPVPEGPAPPGGPGNGSGPAHEKIAVRAYQLWEDRGRPQGTDREDWFEAERQLQGQAEAQ
ncbi:MAG: DUF2934 domain-containing protein [Isosphaeraceae bacterium]|nr:DUF2934 domain-containing protein [Isosphaeraceae bacterium]